MVMKINARELVEKLDGAENLDMAVAVLLDNAKDMTSEEFDDFKLPTQDIITKLKAREIKAGFGLGSFAPLQPPVIVDPNKLKNLKNVKYAPQISKRDAAMLTQEECVNKKFCSSKEFGQKVTDTIYQRKQERNDKEKNCKTSTIMGVTKCNTMG